MLLLPHSHVGCPGAPESLSGEDLIVMLSERPAVPAPRRDMIAERDGLVAPGCSLAGSNAPELHELRRADDGRAGPHDPIQVISATVAGHAADARKVGARRPEAAPAVHDVVLDDRIRRPPVQGKIAVAGGRPDPGVVSDDSR